MPLALVTVSPLVDSSPSYRGPAPRSAHSWGPACLQAGSPKGDPDVPTYQSEDCLLLNIFTPSVPRLDSEHTAQGAPLLPVMVFFHG